MEKFSTFYQKIEWGDEEKEVYKIGKFPHKCQRKNAPDKYHCNINNVINPVPFAVEEIGKSLYAKVAPPDECRPRKA